MSQHRESGVGVGGWEVKGQVVWGSCSSCPQWRDDNVMGFFSTGPPHRRRRRTRWRRRRRQAQLELDSTPDHNNRKAKKSDYKPQLVSGTNVSHISPQSEQAPKQQVPQDKSSRLGAIYDVTFAQRESEGGREREKCLWSQPVGIKVTQSRWKDEISDW